MKIIACVDNNLGMLFNNRRQSQDRVLREKMIKTVGNSKIYFNSFSQKLFLDNKEDNLFCDDDFINKATTNDYCFIENIEMQSVDKEISEVILFKWNKTYPGDFFFDLSLDEFKLENSEDFTGSSHEKITMEIYRK